jgi:hypothetical protein
MTVKNPHNNEYTGSKAEEGLEYTTAQQTHFLSAEEFFIEQLGRQL